MKGIVFAEFLTMVDEMYSMNASEQLIEELHLASGGAYTTVGTYDSQEMNELVVKLSEITAIPVPDLLRTFGRFLLLRFVKLFPGFFDSVSSTFEFLPLVDSYVHLEVRKLYDDAELPTFDCVSPGPGRLEMIYRSARNLPDLAEGLILGTAEHFRESINIERRKIEGDPNAEMFIISRNQG